VGAAKDCSSKAGGGQLRRCSKMRWRKVGRSLGLAPEESSAVHPFPGSSLAIRILGR